MSDTAPEAPAQDAPTQGGAARAEALIAMSKGKGGQKPQRTDYVPLSATEAAAGHPARRPAGSKPVDYQPYAEG